MNGMTMHQRMHRTGIRSQKSDSFAFCILLSALWLATAFNASGDGPPNAATNLLSTLRAARQSHQPVLAVFSATWCGPCKLMGQTTYKDPAVLAELAKL